MKEIKFVKFFKTSNFKSRSYSEQYETLLPKILEKEKEWKTSEYDYCDV